MRRAVVYRNKEVAGTLTENNDKKYIFRYDDAYFNDTDKSPVSLTLAKSKQAYESDVLFPFFSSLLSEGANKKLQCRYLKIDERDSFGLLLATARFDTIGAISIQPLKQEDN